MSSLVVGTAKSSVCILKSWTKVLRHFCVSGAFSNSHRSNRSPHPTNNVGRVCPEFFPSFNFVWGGGRENCKKISKGLHFFKREPRNDRKNMNIAVLSKDFCPGLQGKRNEDYMTGKRSNSNLLQAAIIHMLFRAAMSLFRNASLFPHVCHRSLLFVSSQV